MVNLSPSDGSVIHLRTESISIESIYSISFSGWETCIGLLLFFLNNLRFIDVDDLHIALLLMFILFELFKFGSSMLIYSLVLLIL